VTQAICRLGHFCRLIEKWRQKDRAWPLLQIVVCESPYQTASCDLCRRRKIMSHGGATQRGGIGDNSLAAFIELISVVFVAKHVFGDRSGALRRFGIMSPAEALCWRQVTHCVVLLSLRRDWAGDKNRCSWRQFACSYRLKLLPPVCSANGFQPSRFERLHRPKALPLAAVRAGLRPTEAFALSHVARNKADALPN
jgi:hypothetical protein